MNTQPNDKLNSDSGAQAEPNPPQNPGVLSLRTALSMLWEKSADTLTTDELKWFVGFNEQASIEIDNLSKIMTNTACLVIEDENTGSFQSQKSTSTLLFSLAHQLDTISGMLHVGGEAKYRLVHPELYRHEAKGGEHEEQ